MEFKRTGWNLYNRPTFVEIVPQDDLQEHQLGDECWCVPRVEQDPGALPVITHNSKDRREEHEK